MWLIYWLKIKYNNDKNVIKHYIKIVNNKYINN